METIPQTRGDNLVDQLANSADRALDATRHAATAAITKVAGKVHDVRDVASPMLERVTSPFESVARQTRQAPWRSLLMAAAAGAALMAIASLLSRSQH